MKKKEYIKPQMTVYEIAVIMMVTSMRTISMKSMQRLLS